jgi:hypothetical protein
MTDWNESGAAPVEDAAVEHPPTVSEVLEAQKRLEREAGHPDEQSHLKSKPLNEPKE